MNDNMIPPQQQQQQMNNPNNPMMSSSPQSDQFNEQVLLVESIIQRLKENPFYMRFMEITEIMDKGEQIMNYIENMEVELNKIKVTAKLHQQNQKQHQQFVQGQPQFQNVEFNQGEHYAFQQQYPMPEDKNAKMQMHEQRLMMRQQQQQPPLQQPAQQMNRPVNPMQHNQMVRQQRMTPNTQQAHFQNQNNPQMRQQSPQQQQRPNNDGGEIYGENIQNPFNDDSGDNNLNLSDDDVQFEGLPEFEDDDGNN